MIGLAEQYCTLFELGDELPNSKDDAARVLDLEIDGQPTKMIMSMALPNTLVQQVHLMFFVNGYFMCHVTYDINYRVTAKDRCKSALDTLKYYTIRETALSYNLTLMGGTTMEEAEHVFMMALMSKIQ